MVLHWLVAAGIAFLFIQCFLMMEVEGPDQLIELNFHRSVGVTVFALVLVRIWWRMTRPPPPVPMPELQAWIAEFVHLVIYGLLVVNGIAGTVGWIASGDPIVFFGMLVADAHPSSPSLNGLCILVGLTTARVLLLMIALHVLAVLKHEWFDRDRLVERMLPGPSILLPLNPREIVQRMRERRRKRREQRGSSPDSQGPVTPR